ncbi:NADPH-dependent FMN reductase [Actibacterium mucosum KCTC 23349]|uniref:NADPH-dependent FMN reductase n=1 Tax=Actibacterium mucosum KCTC 23349 TaxID=1454373 RepID=A0A037ZQ54_9RHOB|nr:NAD(P)H-dependent oxidoreductase [Actibacterium mucosum]KAJ56952.1 NADPH-dependent FMN reductase [Actibacterium mucosum KCTC 23349]
MTKLLGISGALRENSVNRLLIREAARLFDPDEFVEANLRLPLYDGDVEDTDGIPDAVQLLSDQIAAADAVIVASPEYNKSISGVLKNALDWVSRTKGSPWRDKPVALMTATAGRSGGERVQWIMHLSIMPFRPRLINGPEVLVGSASSQFDENGRLTNERYEKNLTALMENLRAAIPA